MYNEVAIRIWNDRERVAIWALFLALLGVLLPHTKWAFAQFEPSGSRLIPWLGAIVFEGYIAALTWRLSTLIRAGDSVAERYVNATGAGLLLAIVVSTAANWNHAEAYASTLPGFESYGVPPLLATVLFGAILPIMSFLTAHILSTAESYEVETVDAEYVEDVAETTPALPYNLERFDLSDKSGRLEAMRHILDVDPDVDDSTLEQALEVSRTTVYAYKRELNGAGS